MFPAVLILNLIISFVPVERKREIGYNILKNFESVADYGRENECNAHAGAEKIAYIPHEYPHGDEAVDGVTVAGLIGADPAAVFKTLVLRGASKAVYVFVIPVAAELDLKKRQRP